MKSIFLSLAIAAIALVSLTGQASAQDNPPVLIDDFVPDLSLPIFKSDLGSGDKAVENSAIHYRALRDFQKEFSSISDVNWTRTFDGGYVAHFRNNSIQTMVAYNGKGVWHHTIHRYTEKQLPKDIRQQVKSIYYDFDITGVTVVELSEGTVYLVNLQDDTSLKLIRITDEEMQEVANYQRG